MGYHIWNEHFQNLSNKATSKLSHCFHKHVGNSQHFLISLFSNKAPNTNTTFSISWVWIASKTWHVVASDPRKRSIQIYRLSQQLPLLFVSRHQPRRLVRCWPLAWPKGFKAHGKVVKRKTHRSTLAEIDAVIWLWLSFEILILFESRNAASEWIYTDIVSPIKWRKYAGFTHCCTAWWSSVPRFFTIQ